MADITESFKRGDTLASDTNPRNSGTAARNYTCQKSGNDKGFISFGEINKDGAVTSGCSLHTNDGDHQMYMEIDGERKGCTTFTGPGSFNLVHGRDNDGDNDMSISFVAKDGNIFIKASDGDIIMEANNISLLARDSEGSKGNITLTATENISNNSKKFITNATIEFDIVSSGKGQLIANSILKCYGSVFQGVDDSVAVKPAKNGGQNFQRQATIIT
jgi:hypothetical protein